MGTLIIPLLLFTVPLVILVLVLRGGGKITAARRARLASARIEKARIVGIGSVLRYRGPNKIALLPISLQIEPSNGAPYSASTSWFVETPGMPRAQPGQELSVRVDASDASIIYPAAADGYFEYDWEARPA